MFRLLLRDEHGFSGVIYCSQMHEAVDRIPLKCSLDAHKIVDWTNACCDNDFASIVDLSHLTPTIKNAYAGASASFSTGNFDNTWNFRRSSKRVWF